MQGWRNRSGRPGSCRTNNLQWSYNKGWSHNLTEELQYFNFFKFNIILLLIVYNYHFAICYLLLSAQPSSFFTRLYTRDFSTVSLIFILINAILYYVICLMASVPTQASLPVKLKTERLFRAEWCGGVRTVIIHGSTTTSVPIWPSDLSPLYDSSIWR